MKSAPRFELRLLAAAALAIVLVLAACHNRAIAQEKPGAKLNQLEPGSN